MEVAWRAISFCSGADGLYVGKFMDFFCGGPVVGEGTAVGVYYKYQYRSLLHALQGEAGVGVELWGTGQDASAFFGSFNALFHEGKGGLLAFPFHHDEFPGLAVLGRGSHMPARRISRMSTLEMSRSLKKRTLLLFENQVVHSISTFPCILISDYAFFIIHRFRWFVGEMVGIWECGTAVRYPLTDGCGARDCTPERGYRRQTSDGQTVRLQTSAAPVLSSFRRSEASGEISR